MTYCMSKGSITKRKKFGSGESILIISVVGFYTYLDGGSGQIARQYLMQRDSLFDEYLDIVVHAVPRLWNVPVHGL